MHPLLSSYSWVLAESAKVSHSVYILWMTLLDKRHSLSLPNLFFSAVLSLLTFPAHNVKLLVFKGLVIWFGVGFIRRVSILAQILMSQSLLSCDASVWIKVQHALQKVNCWNRCFNRSNSAASLDTKISHQIEECVAIFRWCSNSWQSALTKDKVLKFMS